MNVPQIKQERTQWCWAACADMVLHYYSAPDVQQCKLANWLFGQSTCCMNPGSPVCNRPCRVEDVSQIYDQLGLKSHYRGAPVSFQALKAEIDAGRPVEVGYAWSGGGGHAAVVRAWREDGSGQFVSVNDPWFGPTDIYFDRLRTAYGFGTWSWTWTGLRR